MIPYLEHMFLAKTHLTIFTYNNIISYLNSQNIMHWG